MCIDISSARNCFVIFYSSTIFESVFFSTDLVYIDVNLQFAQLFATILDLILVIQQESQVNFGGISHLIF